jgi:hypothetical protein
MPAPLPHPPPLELRNRLADSPLEANKLLIHPPAEFQKRSQRHDHPPGGGFVLQHHKPGLRGITGHSDMPFCRSHLPGATVPPATIVPPIEVQLGKLDLQVIRLARRYLLDDDGL